MPQKGLFPPIEPYNRGYLKRGKHKIYFEESGNPKGLPVLYFHGGPGAGCSPKDRRFFNPKKFRIILFDQRGCGRSKPIARIKENTTWHLIQDAKNILDKLNINKVLVFGGSWGSTMALIFTIIHPNCVSGIIARGIFLGERSEIDYSENGLIAQHFPQAWERFTSLLSADEKRDPLASYYKKLFDESTKSRKLKKLFYEWARFEDVHLKLLTPSQKNLDKYYAKADYKISKAISTLEIYYLYNNCFLRDGYITKNICRIPRDIPISLVHGKYDVICPPKSAYKLYRALSRHNVQLHWTHAGHSKSDIETEKKLLSEVKRLYKEIKEKDKEKDIC